MIPAGSTITQVQLFATSRQAGATPATFKLSYRRNGTDGAFIDSPTTFTPGAGWTTISQVWSNLSWTVGDLNQLEIGVAVNAAGASAAQVTQVYALIAAYTQIPNHNSISTVSTRWTGSGGWGIAGGKYGDFTCETCHTRGTTNIKRVRTTILTPDSSKGFIPGDGQPILFTRITGSEGAAGTLGDDSNTPRTTSSKICEICHTYNASRTNGVTAHAYNSAGECSPEPPERQCDGLHCVPQAHGCI